MTGLRERQKAARQQRILESATELFRREGYDKTRMEDIAAMAGISTGTTYNYYQTKADILIAVVSMEVEEILATGAKIVESTPSSVAGALMGLASLYNEHSLVYLSKEMWRMAMSFSIQRPQTPFSQRYTALDKRLCLQIGEMVLVLQKQGLVSTNLVHSAVAEIIFSNLNMMFIEFVKCEDMTMDELEETVNEQLALVASLISTDIQQN